MNAEQINPRPKLSIRIPEPRDEDLDMMYTVTPVRYELNAVCTHYQLMKIREWLRACLNRLKV
jgi:hypothetical protein